MTAVRWDRSINHQGEAALSFFRQYFAGDRKLFYVGGAGFDPRSTLVLKHLIEARPASLRGLFLREERATPDPSLTERAAENAEAMRLLAPDSATASVEIFADDGAVVGGRNGVAAVSAADFGDATDVVIDFSALSVGVAFPVARYVYEAAVSGSLPPNVHLVVVDRPRTDEIIRREAHDTARYVTGFSSDAGLIEHQGRAKLWLPLLVERRRNVLQRIYLMVRPDDVCPILPFPASDPRRADTLVEYYAEEFESTWEVTPRSLVYAAEKNPLDLYRTILRIDDFRQRVFAELDGAQTVLSPMANKALSIGAFLAAVERDFPVAYVEAEAYHLEAEATGDADVGEVIHVWIHEES